MELRDNARLMAYMRAEVALEIVRQISVEKEDFPAKYDAVKALETMAAALRGHTCLEEHI